MYNDVIYVNKIEGAIPEMDFEVKVTDLEYKNGRIYIEGRPYAIQTLTEVPCTPVGLGFDYRGLPVIITNDDGEEYRWDWNDVMLYAIRIKKADEPQKEPESTEHFAR